MQQQLHGEMCDVLSQAAAMQLQLPYQKSLFTSVVDFADAAHDANKNNQVLLASQLLDVDCYLLKLNHQIIASIYNDPVGYAQAGLLAISDGLSDVGHMIANPAETIKGLGKALYYVLETAAFNGSEMVLEYPEIFEPMRDDRNAQIAAGLKHLGEQIENSTGPDRFGALVRFGTNVYASEKIIHAIGDVCGFVKEQAKVMRTLEGVAGMAEEQGLTQEVIQAAKKMEVAAQENIAKNVATELIEAQMVQKNPRKPALIVDPVLMEERITEARQCFSEVVKESLEEIKMLAQKYDKVSLEFEGIVQDIFIDVEHVFLPEVMPKYDYNKVSKLKALEEMRVTGWHHGYLQQFEDAGLIDVVKKISKNDCVYIESVWPYGHTTIKKTLFPSSWTREQVMEKIVEAMNNIIEIKQPEGSFEELGRKIVGKTIEGIEIEIKLKRNTLQDPWKIATAYVKESYITGVIK